MNTEFITSREYTTGKAAKLLRVAQSTVTAMCERGDFPHARKAGKWWRIPGMDLLPMLPHELKPKKPEAQP